MYEPTTNEHADLARLKARLEVLLEATHAALWEWNVSTGEVVLDEAWARMLGYTLDELHPATMETWKRLVHPEDLEAASRRLEEHLRGTIPCYSVETRLRHKSGAWVWVEDYGRVAARGPGGEPLLMYGAHLDLTEAKLAEERIREVSVHDHLTGLLNRRHLFEELGMLVDKCRRGKGAIAVAVLDLDHFKEVNDRHGHLAGDEVLREVARTLKENIRPYDLAGRYGGEEFVVICQDTDRRAARKILGRSLRALRWRRWRFPSGEAAVTFTCGIAESEEWERQDITPEGIIARADSRMYAGKAAGRNRIVTGLEEVEGEGPEQPGGSVAVEPRP